MLHADYEWILAKSRTDLMQNIEWRWNLIHYITAQLQIIGGFIIGIILVLVLIIANPLSSLIAFLFLGSISIILFGVVKRKIDSMAEHQAALRKSMFNTVRNSLNGIKDIFISKSESHFLDQFQSTHALVCQENRKIDFYFSNAHCYS